MRKLCAGGGRLRGKMEGREAGAGRVSEAADFSLLPCVSLSSGWGLTIPNCFHTPTCPQSDSHTRRSSVEPGHSGRAAGAGPCVSTRGRRGAPRWVPPLTLCRWPSRLPGEGSGKDVRSCGRGASRARLRLASVWGDLVKDMRAGR